MVGSPEDDEAIRLGDVGGTRRCSRAMRRRDGRDVLQHDARVDEVEGTLSRIGRGRMTALTPELAGRDRLVQQPAPGRPSPPRCRPRLACVEPRAERPREPADAAAEVERPLVPPGRPSVSTTSSTCAISASPVAKNSPRPSRRPSGPAHQHRPERVDLGQMLPVLLVALQAHGGSRSGGRRPRDRATARRLDRIQGCRSAGSRGFSIANANRFAWRGRTRVMPATIGRARRRTLARAPRSISRSVSGSSNSRKKRIRWRAWGANDATVFSTSRSDQR